MIRRFLILLISASLCTCKDRPKPNANDIITKSIKVSGGDFIEHSIIYFDFRDRHYSAIRDGNYNLLSRTTIQGTDTIIDAISSTDTNLGRFVNNRKIEIEDSMAVKYQHSVNAVHYFSLLPYKLNDPAVIKSYLGEAEINDIIYHKIKITFKEEGGGEDFEDEFIYWINIETDKVEYLAYSYEESDGIGYRFREAYNERYIEGIRFVDYINYKPVHEDVDLETMDDLFLNNGLEDLSKIELKNIKVKL